MAAPSARTRPYLVLLVVCSAWGTVGLVVRAVDLPGAAVAAGRVWTGAIGLGVVLWIRRPPPLARADQHRGRLVLTGALLAVHWLAFISALQRAPIGTVVLIVFLGPPLLAVAAPRVLGERSSPATLGALALAVAGFLLVAGPAVRSAGAAGVALAAFAAVSYVGLVLASKPLAQIYGGVRLAFLELVVASVVLAVPAAAAGWGEPRGTWAWLLVLGLVHTAAAASLYLWALARVPAVHAGVFGYLEPAGAVLCGWLFLDERPGLGTLAGGLLIVAAGVIVVRMARAVPEPEVAGVGG